MQKLLQDTGIMKKMLAMMLMLGVVAILTASVNAYKIKSIEAQFSDLVNSKLPAIPHLIRGLRLGTEMVKNGYRVAAFPQGSQAAREGRAAIGDNYKSMNDSFAEAARFNPGLASRVGEYRSETGKIHEQVEEAARLAESGQQAAAMQRMIEADAAMTEFSRSTVSRNNERIAEATKISDDLSSSIHRNMLLSLIMSVVAVTGALVVAHRVVKKNVVDPLLELNTQMMVLAKGNHAITIPHGERRDEVGTMSRSVAVFRDQAEERASLEAEKQRAQAEQEMVVSTLGSHLDRLAAGDLNSEIGEHFPHDYWKLRMAYNSALKSLGELIRSVAESASEIRTGTGEIAQASEDLARRTESNAASLEETSAAIAQMDARLKASAGAATATVGRADQAIATVSGGRGLADEAVQAMGRVSDSAKGIDSVIEGLDKIAFQTRVLAMNAAVEAGRAGEAGRGFAVVADLVSALAMRAEEEAKRARDQLTVTQTDIVTAVEAVGQVDTALQNISADVGEVHQLLGQMANDNQAQALAITEINSAIVSMDQSTQQNAAMVEQTSAAARNLMTEVAGLAEQASRFRCDGGRPSPVVAPAPTAAKPAARAPRLPKLGKEGAYQSPVKPLPLSAISVFPQADDEDWKEF